jgi:hypothetical protein
VLGKNENGKLHSLPSSFLQKHYEVLLIGDCERCISPTGVVYSLTVAKIQRFSERHNTQNW